jgi:hypothetical protein
MFPTGAWSQVPVLTVTTGKLKSLPVFNQDTS